jgi:hypothetical protein
VKHLRAPGALIGCIIAAPAMAQAPAMPTLDHVYVIMMENHSYQQIIGNVAGAPYINRLAHEGNLARAYFAVGHPSLTNYLEVVGGSNFGVISDASPDWRGAAKDTLLIAPLAGQGMDRATPAAYTGATGGADIPAARYTAMTIGDQLTAAGKSWKTYQEALPPSGFDGVNFSDGLFTNLSGVPPLGVQYLYAVKHNPFAYFTNVQAGKAPGAVAGFAGLDGLYADLRAGTMPTFSFIVPDQCHDMHGVGNFGPFCATDSMLVVMGDRTVEHLVGSIRHSSAWKSGRSAIVLLWDENDFGTDPNRVAFIVVTNYGAHGTPSDVPYNHFSFLRTLQTAFGLPCLNHSCDANVRVMADVFTRAP